MTDRVIQTAVEKGERIPHFEMLIVARDVARSLDRCEYRPDASDQSNSVTFDKPMRGHRKALVRCGSGFSKKVDDVFDLPQCVVRNRDLSFAIKLATIINESHVCLVPRPDRQ